MNPQIPAILNAIKNNNDSMLALARSVGSLEREVDVTCCPFMSICRIFQLRIKSVFFWAVRRHALDTVLQTQSRLTDEVCNGGADQSVPRRRQGAPIGYRAQRRSQYQGQHMGTIWDNGRWAASTKNQHYQALHKRKHVFFQNKGCVAVDIKHRRLFKAPSVIVGRRRRVATAQCVALFKPRETTSRKRARSCDGSANDFTDSTSIARVGARNARGVRCCGRVGN
ncbi:hypothetical protein BDB00DRAFT_938806 [Zychaea mexicana]|uniref:uncharacterized protein n=1 Tax=Zychaea mexicana TaxID=64656 RepID=UPI0022FEB251|nr:uncharacterized protein BDB00DRAFT_938806 [Zychaea mexicana]KAI9493631.1 hypothetical protein BDB00DRAFT_938806 [Zychaea mexicana]